MDITEAFRTEDISKTDFFDFVVTPDVADVNSFQQFNRSMKSVGIFLESSFNNNNNNNNEESAGDRKETNNNHLILNNGASEVNLSASGFVDSAFWNSSTGCDKESVRWEASMLEDLNCWSQEQEGTDGSGSKSTTQTENTDGAIYTLTVLNGAEQSGTWYRPPDGQEEEIPVTVTHNPTTNSPHASMTSHQNTIDIDSFLNSIPSSIPHSSPENNPFQNGFPPRISTTETPTVSNDIVTSAESVKTEFSYEDSGYADTKEEMCNQIEIVLTPNPPGQFNNNNDWKISDSNTTDRSTVGSAESLLRNALQGKAILARYNGSHSVKTEKPEELRRVLGTPPSSKSSSETAVYSTDIEEDIKTQSPLMAVSLEGGTVVMFEGGNGNGTMLIDSDNPSSAQSMDDIFLSQLDAVSYPEDYEKLKRIENEVAESVEHYCNLDHAGQNIYIPTHINDPLRLSSLSHLDHSILNSMPSTTSTSKSSKKYSKKSSTTTKTHNHQLQSPGSSSGVRKERSLHYCNICSKGFKDKYSVNVHIRTHTGEKPFACSLCGKSFRQKAHLAKHYHTHLAQAKNAANGGSSSKPAANKSR